MSELSDSDKSQKYYELQLNLIREELRHLKNCQVTFLTASITITSTIFAIIVNFSSKIPFSEQPSTNVLENLPFHSFPYLIPLLIILPAWSIFFDKARSVSRAVGYCRIIEQLITGATATNFSGWETDLQNFRKNQHQLYVLRKQLITEKKIDEINVNKVNNSYWLWTYFIFFFLAWISISLAATITYSKYHVVEQPLIAIILASLYISYRNAEIYGNFTNATMINSYNTNTCCDELLACP